VYATTFIIIEVQSLSKDSQYITQEIPAMIAMTVYYAAVVHGPASAGAGAAAVWSPWQREDDAGQGRG